MTYAGNSQMERTGATPTGAGNSATFVNSILGVDKRTSSTDEVADTPNNIDTSGTTYYIRDPGGAVLGQFRQNSGNTVTYAWLQIDAIGSIRHVTDASGVHEELLPLQPVRRNLRRQPNRLQPLAVHRPV